MPAQTSPIYRNFELDVRMQRAEAIAELFLAAWEQIKKMFTTPPAARGSDAQTIRLAWLKAAA